MVTIDLSKAYDSVCYNLLLAKLKAYGVCQEALELIQSYLSDRFQHVRCNVSYSNWLPVKLLPQLQAIFSDPERLINLKFELAIAIDVGEHFVKANYFLEGDGPLVLSCHEKFHAFARACRDPTFLTCMQSQQRSPKKILPKT